VFSGHVQIQHEAYLQNPSLRNSFLLDSSLTATLDGTSFVKGYAPRIMGEGLISFENTSLGAAIIGIHPDRERQSSTMMNRLHQGEFFRSDSSHVIVLGSTLLKNLGAQIGDQVVILAQGFDGSLGNLKFTIGGTVKTGSKEFDGFAVFIGFRTAQELLMMHGRVSSIAILLHDLHDIPASIETLTPSVVAQGLTLRTWNALMPDLEQAIALDDVSGILFLGILLVVVAFGIMNTVLMSVTERFREFGVVLAVGMSSARLVLLVVLEMTFIVFIGLAIGNALAFGINYYIIQNPIVFSGEFAQMYTEYGFLPRIESSLRWTIFVNTTSSIFGIALIAILYPLGKLYRLEPLKGIRYT
jgi:ABC-type lipoprotein release transport system permease subunit